LVAQWALAQWRLGQLTQWLAQRLAELVTQLVTDHLAPAAREPARV
jgi:hypothetical protein